MRISSAGCYGPEYVGSGFLAGRSLTGDIKSLPRWLTYEAISKWVVWPRFYDSAPLRRKIQRPTGFPLIGLPLKTYHGVALGSARETPDIMQMYG